jgi:hypothetical protein
MIRLSPLNRYDRAGMAAWLAPRPVDGTRDHDRLQIQVERYLLRRFAILLVMPPILGLGLIPLVPDFDQKTHLFLGPVVGVVVLLGLALSFRLRLRLETNATELRVLWGSAVRARLPLAGLRVTTEEVGENLHDITLLCADGRSTTLHTVLIDAEGARRLATLIGEMRAASEAHAGSRGDVPRALDTLRGGRP